VWLPQQDTPLFLNSSRTQVLTIPLLVVDLEEVGVISSWVLGILASVQQQGIEVHIYHPASDMHGVRKATHLDKLLDVREGLDHIE